MVFWYSMNQWFWWQNVFWLRSRKQLVRVKISSHRSGNETRISMAVASFDGRSLVVAVLRRAVDRTSSGFWSKGARRPESSAITLIGRQVFVFQVKHRERDVKVLRFGWHIVRTSAVRSARFSILQVVKDECGSYQSSENETGNTSADDHVDRHRSGNGNRGHRSVAGSRFSVRSVAFFSFASASSDPRSVRTALAIAFPFRPRTPSVTVDLFKSGSCRTNRAGGFSASNSIRSDADSASPLLVIPVTLSPGWPASPISRTRLSVASSLSDGWRSETVQIWRIARFHSDLISPSTLPSTLWPICPVFILNVLGIWNGRCWTLAFASTKTILWKYLSRIGVDCQWIGCWSTIGESESLFLPRSARWWRIIESEKC